MNKGAYANHLGFEGKLKVFVSWFLERFPPINVVSSYLLFFFIYACSTNGEGGGVATKDLILPLGILTQLLLLRVLDEFKDHAYDKEHHPDRILQKGVLQLNDLKYLAYFSFGLQIFLNLIWGALWNPFWVAMTVWTGLMTKEFFIADWLRKRVFLYLISHMIVMIFLTYWMLSFYTLNPVTSFYVVSMVFMGSVLYEVSRKTRGLDEDQRLDSYPKSVGFRVNTLLLLGLGASVLGLKFLILRSLSIELHWVYVWDVVAFVFFVYSALRTHIRKSKKSRKLLEANYGGLMLAAYMSFILHQQFWM